MPTPPKPITEHVKNKTYKKSRHENSGVTRGVKGGKPRRPKFIKDKAATAWDSAVKILEEEGLLSRLDLGSLASYSLMWAELQEILKLGEHPNAAWWSAFRGILNDLGMTPAARTRMRVATAPPPKETKSKLDGKM